MLALLSAPRGRVSAARIAAWLRQQKQAAAGAGEIRPPRPQGAGDGAERQAHRRQGPEKGHRAPGASNRT